MTALTNDQLDLLQRAYRGDPMWGGSVATHRLRREVELLFALKLIEADGGGSYRVTDLGNAVLQAHGMSQPPS